MFVVSAAGGSPQPITPDDPFDQGVPTWSPDGKLIVFGEPRWNKPDSEMLIRLLDLTSRTESSLPDSRGKWTPRWSPDGRYIVAQTTDFRSLEPFDWKANRWIPLAKGAGIDDPVWTLDSRYVHFRAAIEGGTALFRVRIPDGPVELLAMHPASEDWWAGVSPSGSPLALDFDGNRRDLRARSEATLNRRSQHPGDQILPLDASI